jgi:hypothetical protein
LLQYATENRATPRAVTGKWLPKNYKLTTRLKNKTWTNPQIKNNKMSHKLRLIRPDTTQKSRVHVLKILNTTSTISGENYESSLWVQVSL